jgi:hypothetical protein
VGTHRKHSSGHSTAKSRRAIASNTTNTSKGRAASNQALLEQKNVTAAEDHKQADPLDSPQQADPAASSPQEAAQSKRPEIKTPVEPPAALHQEETAASARKDQQDEQPTAPRAPAAPSKTRPLPERKLYEKPASATTPAAPAPGQAGPFGPASALTDINWMPPAEDQVARFLTNMADITPPPTRERQENRAPGFILPSAISPEDVKRKKAKAEPFWSQVVATPMEQSAPPSPSIRSQRITRPRRATRQRLRAGKGWLMLIGGILIVLILGLVLLLLMHAGLLHR